jgi:hypothetical protein
MVRSVIKAGKGMRKREHTRPGSFKISKLSKNLLSGGTRLPVLSVLKMI